MLPILRFSPEFGLVFCGVVFFCEDLRVAFFGFVISQSCLFWACFLQVSVLRIAFYKNCMALLLFQFTTKRNLDVFLCKFANFGLVFSVVPP